MAKKASARNEDNRFGGYRFINVSLDKTDKERLAELLHSDTYPIEGLSGLCEEGYKVSFSYDSKNHSHICSLTDVDEGSPFHKCILTGRGSTALNGWLSACYKHFVLAEGDWEKFGSREESGSSGFG